MRWMLLAAAASGCGRIGFEVVPDGAPDTVTCSAGTFCSICEASDITVIHIGVGADDAVADFLGMRVAQGCGTGQPIQTVGQNTAGVLDPTTNRPLLAASTLGVMGGGPFFNQGFAYLQMNDTPIYYDVVGSNLNVLARNGALLFDMPKTSLSTSHDVGLLMVAKEPISGATFLAASGWYSQGGIAAGDYFATQIATMLQTSESGWYVFEWQDQDADMNPSAPDTLTIVASGP